ncbi:MAG: oxidoreductase [Ginsengibacter sp.]
MTGIRPTLFLLLLSVSVHSQTVKILNTGTLSSFRGLSVVSDRIIWASGNKGTVGRSIDGGQNWKWMVVKGFEKNDFRDIEGFSATTAIVMGISSPAYILKTTDGGDSWKICYENKDTSMFLDAMDFSNRSNGVVIGDPIRHKIFIAQTFDGGDSWRPVSKKYLPDAETGEACFASSGTNIRLHNHNYYFITGGLRSRYFAGSKPRDLPILQGRESTGANSIAIKNKRVFIVTGGDFNTPDSQRLVCFITKNGGKTWQAPNNGPFGYRSCVEFLEGNNWISCGLNGVDYSKDDGRTWEKISGEGFNVCRKAKLGKSVFFAGPQGRVGILTR